LASARLMTAPGPSLLIMMAVMVVAATVIAWARAGEPAREIPVTAQ